ncbi:MAG: sigma 54-interacting transcriptional regulator [Clostridiales bacterium]|nr:sigma 54-interacting transcriptional regulator [Clostridiales bacterium]
MEKIRIDPEEIREISPILKGIMNLAFDESCIMDKDGYIVHCSDSSPLIWGRPNEESIGMHISELDSASPYPELLKTGAAVLGKIHIINGMTCITHMIPLFDSNDEIIGAFGVIIFRGIEKIKKLVRENYIDSKSSELYDQLSRAEARYSLNDLAGQSQSLKDVIKLAKKAAKYEYPVLIRGETGCGKEIIAGGIHTESHGKEKKPFVRINCTAIPQDLLESELFGYEKGAFSGAYSTKQGKFEVALDGTILLDEIGDLNPLLQGKLLRVIEESEFERLGGNNLIPLHARIIASTNRNLEQLMEEGKFREDLYYRLSGIEIEVAPLRERREDIMPLVNHFSKQNDNDLQFSDEAVDILQNYNWPGNVRELRNMIVKLSVMYEGKIIDKELLQRVLRLKNDSAYPSPHRDATLSESVIDLEKERITKALEVSDMSVSGAARLLGVSRSSLYNMMHRFNITLERHVK